MAKKSKDPSTKVGCVIVGPHDEIRSTGFNGFPRNSNDLADHRHKRPLKYKWTEHAERNAIYNAGRKGTSCLGAKLYINWLPCTPCARGVIQAGISEIIVHD